ncbi:MLO-like protein 13 [Turnera subulata]|uniref:MLO-like protein n=1 Tax=Turnera subulata TaxID=218843 RepID=A0A9Q0JES8_9ROSI|nr:MLO-like protein 13 [Turnera subulata]
MGEAEESNSLEYTPTWVVATVCFVIVLISLLAERGLHKLGKWLTRHHQDALFEALQKLKEELMLLGFISLLLTVSQRAISRICVPPSLTNSMLPCKRSDDESSHNAKYSAPSIIHSPGRLLSADNAVNNCARRGKVPLVSLEALHHLHIFIFVLAVVHVIFCVTTMFLGGARIRQWKNWEDSIRNSSTSEKDKKHEHHHISLFIRKHEKGYWRKSAVVSWTIAFFKQFFGSITKSDYIALRKGFITTHCSHLPNFDFHKYMIRTLEIDFKRVVTISWYLWLFIVLFLLLNLEGWHTYFWLAFLPVILLLLIGAKLEHIITRLGHGVAEKKIDAIAIEEARAANAIEEARVQPSDEHFWLERPAIILDLIQFILFQNSFEMAFFFWIWSTYGFHSCIMERLGYIVPRLIMGVFVQVLCSYSTLPLYALVSQMGTKIRKGMFREEVHTMLEGWAGSAKHKMDKLGLESSQTVQEEMSVNDDSVITNIEFSATN